MSSIASIIQRGRGTAGHWRVIHDGTHSLYHYGTKMLEWEHTMSGTRMLEQSTGWGSVSDQNGMNTAFRILNLPYRYCRDQRGGGPRIEAT